MRRLRDRSTAVASISALFVALSVAGPAVSTVTPAGAASRVRNFMVWAPAQVRRGTGSMSCPSTDARFCKFPTPGNDAVVNVDVPVTFTSVTEVDVVAIFSGDCLNAGEQFLVLSGVVASVSSGTKCLAVYQLSVKNGNDQSDLDVFANRRHANFNAWFAPGSGNLAAVLVVVGGAAR